MSDQQQVQGVKRVTVFRDTTDKPVIQHAVYPAENNNPGLPAFGTRSLCGVYYDPAQDFNTLKTDVRRPLAECGRCFEIDE